MKIRCLGGFKEVGRNAILLESSNDRILMDYGLKVETAEIPLKITQSLTALLLSHPHLDHSGMVPFIYHNQICPIFSTISTFDQSNMLLKDSMKVAKLKNFPERFSLRDMEKMQNHEMRITYGQEFEIGSTLVDVADAGHVPGSCMFLLKSENKKILYTGDFKLRPTQLLSGARLEAIKDVDVVIMESTYGNREHPPREKIEKELYNTIQQTIANNGVALLPCFAVGRAAELLMVLDRFRQEFRIFLDGMAKEATEIALRYPEFLRDPKAVKKALEDVVPLYSNEDRKMAISKPSVIITTAGMMSGGPVIHYIKKLYDRENCSIIFTGYQVPNTPGRYLLESGRYKEDDLDLKVKMNVKYLDFSAHASRSELLELIKKTNPKKVICMHGDHCEEFAQDIKKGFGIEAVAPANGDVVGLD